MPEEGLSIPSHVPEEMVCDFDYIVAPKDTVDPQRTWAARMRENGDIFFTPRNGGIWIVQSADLAVKMMRETHIFSADPKYNKTRQFEVTLLPVQADPPEHAEYRKAMGAYFAPGNMRKLEPEIREMAVSLIEEVKGKGGCEFVSEIAEKFPIFIFLGLVKAPLSDREELLEYAAMFTRTGELSQRSESTRLLGAYLARLFEERRRDPGDDILSKLIQSGFANERPMTDKELQGLGTLLFLGGLDTVKSVLSFVILFLAQHPGHYAQIVEKPELIPAAVEELLRISGPTMQERALTQDIEFEGVSFKKHDRVTMFLPFISFDPSLNADPERVDFEREISQHLIFGTGIHRCAGSHLARIELRIFLEEWARTFASFRLDPGKAPEMDVGAVWSPKSVPIVWP